MCSRADRITHSPAGNHLCEQREGSQFCSLGVNTFAPKFFPKSSVRFVRLLQSCIYFMCAKKPGASDQTNDVPAVFWNAALGDSDRAALLAADTCHILR